MIQLAAQPLPRLPDGAGHAPPATAPSHVTPESTAAAARLAAELRRSLGQSPQLDKALGQLLSLMA